VASKLPEKLTEQFGEWFVNMDLATNLTKGVVMESAKTGGVDLLKFKKFNNIMLLKDFIRFMGLQKNPEDVLRALR
jgi:hypothetical protein